MLGAGRDANGSSINPNRLLRNGKSSSALNFVWGMARGWKMRHGHVYAGRAPNLNVKGGLCASSTRSVQSFLQENFSRKLAVAEIAALSGLSTSHFIRAFSKTFGVPPHRYVLDQRLDYAESLLLARGMSIAEVAHLAGFSSQSHFTTVMKKYRGVTPSQARASEVVK
ncbi:helix-turn-helix transcriptional regulator [Mesorhizobium sp. 43Arga]